MGPRRMGKKMIFLLTLTVCVVLATLYVVGGTQAYSRYAQTILAEQEHCGGQEPVHICVQAPQAIYSAFYTSYVTSQYPLFTIRYSSSSPKTLFINVTLSHLSQTQTRTVNAGENVQIATFVPTLKQGILQKLISEERTVLHVEVKTASGQPYYINDIPLLFHSRWLMQWVRTNRLQIGAWVTPNDPAVLELVKKASMHLKDQGAGAPEAMSGYQNATAQQVMSQVNALYDTLRLDYHMRYVQASIPYTASNNGNAATQNIKLPAEVLKLRRGMCVEMTTLMAAAVESIGLEPRIVIIPGHAFLGVALDEDEQQIAYWDVVELNNNVAADSAHIAAEALYSKHQRQHTIVDIIKLSDARAALIGPMI